MPRIGNLEYANWLRDYVVPHYNQLRVVHYKDVVPHLPPCSVLNIYTYNHFGTEVLYDSPSENY